MPTARQQVSFCAVLAVVAAMSSLWTSDTAVSLAAQQVPPACVPPEFGDPPIVRPIDRATTGCDLDGEPSASDPAKQPNRAHKI
jgi:hypothetical protein